MAGYDKIDTTIQVTFYQEELLTTRDWIDRTTGEIPTPVYLSFRDKKEIQEKWLYVFWSDGNSYPITFPKEAYPGYENRVNKTIYCGQHMASFGANGSTPKRTADKIKEVVFECYFDDKGIIYWKNITQLWQVPRHRRGNPLKWPQKGRTLPLPLVRNKKNGRYYFLLSSIRLGKKALDTATKPGYADGMSIWCPSPRNGFQPTKDPQGPTPEFMKKLREAKDPKYDQIRSIGVVDPYNLAGDIEQNILEVALTKFMEVCNNFNEGKPVQGWIDNKYPGIQDKIRYQGTFLDMYIIAKIILGYQEFYKNKKGKDPFKDTFDKTKAKDVIKFVDGIKERMRKTCEACARFLINWLSGPAHRLIDLAAAEDTTEPGDEFAAADRALALAHWYNITTFLGCTTRGAAFLANLKVACPDNAVEKILMKYKDKSLPKGDSIDRKALSIAATVIPDLAQRWVLTDANDEGFREKNRYKILQIKAKKIADLLNNIKFFDYPLDTTARNYDEVPEWKSIYGQYKDWIANGMVIYKMPADIAKGIQEDFYDPIYGKYAEKMWRWALMTGPRPLRTVMNKIFENKKPLLANFELAGKLENLKIPWIRIFCLTTNLILGQGEAVKNLSERQGLKRFEGGMNLFLAVGETFEGACTLSGVESVKFKEILEGIKKPTPVRGALVSFARVGVIISIVGLISAVWAVYSSSKEALNAWDSDDYSSVGGYSIAIIGSLILLTNAIWSFFSIAWLGFLGMGFVGLIGLLVFLIGVLIAMIWKDDEWEIFVEHSVFSTNNQLAMTRKFGGDDEWAGEPTGDMKRIIYKGHSISWPLQHQRIGLMNIISKYIIKSKAIFGNIDNQIQSCEVKGISILIDFQFLPFQSEFDIEILSNTTVRPDKEVTFTLHPPDRNHPDWWESGKVHNVGHRKGNWQVSSSVDHSTQHTVLKLTLKGAVKECYDMKANVTLRCDKGVKIKGQHVLFNFSKELGTYRPELPEGVWVFNDRSDSPTVAAEYENIKMPMPPQLP